MMACLANGANRLSILGIGLFVALFVAYDQPLIAWPAAHSYTVNSIADAPDADLDDGECQTATSGECTLRAAIQQANAVAGADTITLPAGNYLLTRTGVREDAALQGDLDITADLTINGAGTLTTTIDGGILNDRVLQVLTGTVTLTNLTIRQGLAGQGGGVFNAATLTLDHCSVENNTVAVEIALAPRGGGIYNSGTLLLQSTVVRDNQLTLQGSGSAIGAGGGILNSGTLLLENSRVQGNRITGAVLPNYGGGIANSGTLRIQTSTIINNHADAGSGFGGGIDSSGLVTLTQSMVLSNTAAVGGGILNIGSLIIERSTIAGNFAGGHTQEFDPLAGGGGISSSGSLTVTNSTISGNSTWGNGAGISGNATLLESVTLANNAILSQNGYQGNGGGMAGKIEHLHNTILAGNQDGSIPGVAPDCSGTVQSQGYNLLGDITGCSITALSNDQAGNATTPIDARLAGLQPNGGQTWTQALLPDSPAIDAGECPDGSTDQRGVLRPQGVTCDSGAYEFEPNPPTQTPVPTSSPTITPTQTTTPTLSLTPTVPPTPARLFVPAVTNGSN